MKRRSLRSPIQVAHAQFVADRPPGADEDVHFCRHLAAAVVTDLTDPGDRVLDPFAGFGTTLQVATSLGREAVGVELLPERCAQIAAAAPGATVVEGDARGLDQLVTGPFRLILTSPPYRTRWDHPHDPLTAYTLMGGSYEEYLITLTGIVAQGLSLLSDDGYLVLNVADIAAASGFTPLARDLAARVGRVARVVQDVTVEWDRLPLDLAADHLLVVQTR